MKSLTTLSSENIQDLEKLKIFLNLKKKLSNQTWTGKLLLNIQEVLGFKKSNIYSFDEKTLKLGYLNSVPKTSRGRQNYLKKTRFDELFLKEAQYQQKYSQITDNQLVRSLEFPDSEGFFLAVPVFFKQESIAVFTFLFEERISEEVFKFLGEITELIAPYLYICQIEKQLDSHSSQAIKDNWNSKKAAKLQRIENSFSKTQEIAEIGSWEMDIETGKVEWSDQLYKIFGYDPSIYRPSFENLAKNTHPDDRVRIQKMLEIAVKKPQPFDYHQRIIRKDGETRVMYGKGDILTDQNNKAIKIIGTAQDITSRKLLESKIKQQEQILKQELRLQVRKTTRQVEEKTEELNSEKQKLEYAHKNILSSMTYARRIQVAFLPPTAFLKEHIENNVTFYRPKDIVSGDFYWMKVQNDKIFLAVVDCTGHGVPGALMSMIGNNLLNGIVRESKIEEPSLILTEFNDRIRTALHQDSNKNRDGMDIALCVIDKKNKKLNFTGAKRPLIYIQNDELHLIKGDSISIGGVQKKEIIFNQHTISFQESTMFYMFSDGFPDQFGGENDKKYGSKNFREFLHQISKEPCSNQEFLLDKEISEWMGMTQKQIDDVMVLGFRL